MPRRLRIQDDDTIYFVTNRCHQQRFFLVPSDRVNDLIVGLLCRLAKRHSVDVYGFVFMSNHFHLLASAPFLNLSQFMRDFQGQLAVRLNWLRGRKGHFWQGRFKAEPVLDDASAISKMVYMLCNPVEAGLVKHPDRWPGVSSWDADPDDDTVSGHLLLQKEWVRHQKTHPDSDKTFKELREETTYELTLEPLPCWAELNHAARRDKLAELVDDQVRDLQRERKKRRKDFLGPDAVLATAWHDRPDSPDTSPQPLCHTTCAKERDEYREHVRETTDHYRKAMANLFDGTPRQRANPGFPRGTYPPGRPRCVGDPRDDSA